MPTRQVPLVVVASSSAVLAESIAASFRRDGSVVYVTHTAGGCLRVATSISPDVIVLDPTLPRRLESLLRAHPASATARIMRTNELARPRIAQPEPEPQPVLHAAA